MKSSIKKCRNSASVRIPIAVLQAARVDLDDAANIREHAGRIVIEPLQKREFDLAALVKGISPKNLHGEVAFAAPVGKET